MLVSVIFVLAFIFYVSASPITVSNQYSSRTVTEINVKIIQSTGPGGCDLILKTGDSNSNSCDCFGGVSDYAFCAYTKSPVFAPGQNSTDKSNVNVGGKCPVLTGESLLCSDLASIGKCLGLRGYNCNVDATGLCHCVDK